MLSLIFPKSNSIMMQTFFCSWGAALKARPSTHSHGLVLNEAYNEVVRNLIKNWESPVVYLRDKGFLPRDYEDTSKIKPNLDALMQRMERGTRNQAKDKPAAKGVSIGIRPREMRNMPSRNERGLKAGYAPPSLDKPMAVDGKGPKFDDQETQLLAMKSRLEQMQPLNTKPALPESKRQSHVRLTAKSMKPVFTGRTYDEMLQQMIDRTNPMSKHANRTNTLEQVMHALEGNSKVPEKLLGLGSVGLNIYTGASPLERFIPYLGGASNGKSKGKEKEAPGKVETGLAAPNYLNWDMKNGRLDHYSSIEKEAYLNQLVRTFGQKLVSKEIQSKGDTKIPTS
ncbi:uncharacterized protein LOC6493930 isoform X2 [Drosophila ananassae]|uniref:uncharacterized protein LOC6493930 isoform X2 n=1 Tax=Drosophila ananassae TaxID=7217 RepID=UPI0013A5D611|nr:uncharacterized protein LOC6493930 isoform X2 [Drosophila ananassae]